jgi:hypothetical protein
VFMDALALFGTRVAVANTRGDRTVGYRSAAIMPCNPYGGDGASVLDAKRVDVDHARFPHLTAVWHPAQSGGGHRGAVPDAWIGEAAIAAAFPNDPLAHHLRAMVANLDAVGWVRVDVNLKSAFAHGAIIVRRPTFHSWARDIVQYLAERYFNAGDGSAVEVAAS